MFRHLFKLIWNKKKQNLLLMSEILVSFMVIFAIFTLVVYYYSNYKQQRGFEYENVWALSFSFPDNVQRADSVALVKESIRNVIKSMPEVKEMSFSSANLPYSNSTMNWDVDYNKNRQHTNIYNIEKTYAEVLQLKMESGRWFNQTDIDGKYKYVVINSTLRNKLFGKEEAVGKVITAEENKFKITGVVQDFKSEGDFNEPGSGMYKKMDSSEHRWNSSILLSVTDKADAAFESRLYKAVAAQIKNSTIEIEQLAAKRISKNKLTLVPMLILLIVGAFLIINVALGLFGVLWYNISKRRGEIGLRRAVGASGAAVSKQLVGEALVLSTISLIVGTFFAVQFPLMNVFDLSANTYLAALLLSILFIYVLVIICALYPGRQAAAIYPAVALHEE
jgi:putative ABC transport system permease protein